MASPYNRGDATLYFICQILKIEIQANSKRKDIAIRLWTERISHPSDFNLLIIDEEDGVMHGNIGFKA